MIEVILVIGIAEEKAQYDLWGNIDSTKKLLSPHYERLNSNSNIFPIIWNVAHWG